MPKTRIRQLTPVSSSTPIAGGKPLDQALGLPNGARFYRCALQVNPHGYAERFRGKASVLEENTYVEAVLAKCVDVGIKAIAITDHSSVKAVERFRSASVKHDISVFPGFELTSSEGVHVLCIYDRDTSAQRLDRLLGALGLENTNPTAQPSQYGFRQILATVTKQGGVTIAAHVTQSNGLLTTLRGQSCIDAWKDTNLLAVQIPGSVGEVPNTNGWQAILQNRNPDYRRERPAADDLAVAVINACDVKEPEDLDKPGASCWIKMSELSIEGLRQAFLDPASRIRLAGDGSWDNHAEVLAMAWEGGFLDGAAVHFSGNLNVLIGGRGTGKSTVLESLRYAFGLEPVGEDAKRQHDGVVRNVLANGTKVSVQVCSHHPAKRDYLVERTVPNPPIVRDAQGNIMSMLPIDVMPRTEIYGQHEIAELTKSPEKLTRLLVRFVERDPGLPQRMVDVQRELERSRAQIIAVRQELAHVEERLATLPVIEETLRKYQEAGIETRLQDQSLIVREERVLKTANERTNPARELLADIRRHSAIDVAFLSDKALDGLPAKPLLRELEAALGDLSSSIREAAASIDAGLNRADGVIDRVRAEWDKRKKAAQAEFERTLRDLQRSKIDGQEFIRLRSQIEELRPLSDRRALLQRSLEEQQNRRRALSAEWEEVKRVEYQQLERASKKVNKGLHGRVRVRVEFGGDRKPLSDLLRGLIGGRLAQTIEAFEAADALSLPELAGLCRGQAEALAKRYGIPNAQAKSLTQAPEEVIMEIEELHFAPTTSVELNVASEGAPEDWHGLNDLSSGQKATAVLLLLLLESDAPLIVDQPEDDLDNRFITDGIVPTIRREKRKRQFIFTTHNANIPVLGDAELIVGLATVVDAGRVKAEMRPDDMGSIDRPTVRRLVEVLLEGGRDAFEMRRRKYNY